MGHLKTILSGAVLRDSKNFSLSTDFVVSCPCQHQHYSFWQISAPSANLSMCPDDKLTKNSKVQLQQKSELKGVCEICAATCCMTSTDHAVLRAAALVWLSPVRSHDCFTEHLRQHHGTTASPRQMTENYTAASRRAKEPRDCSWII